MATALAVRKKNEMNSEEFHGFVPTNSTMESAGKGNVILITPESPRLINNPAEVARVLKESPFENVGKSDVRTNKKKNMIVIELKNPNEETKQSLLKVKNLDRWAVKCSQPITEILTYGVIGPIDTDVNIDDIKEEIIVQGYYENPNECEIVNATRLKKKMKNGYGLVDSDSVRIGFRTNSLPEAVSIYHSYYRVRPYIPPPLRCYNCQRLYHTAVSCKGETRCLLCAGPHTKDNCPKKGTNEYKCANCDGPHKANSRDCYVYNTASEIENVRVTEKKTYREARTHVMVNRNQQEVSEERTLYRDALTGNKRERESQAESSTQGVLHDQGSQTVPETVAPVTDASFVENLKKCLNDILSKYVLRKDAPKKEQIIEEAIEKTFNIPVKPKGKSTETGEKQKRIRDTSSS